MYGPDGPERHRPFYQIAKPPSMPKRETAAGRRRPFLALKTVMEFDARATPFSGGANRYGIRRPCNALFRRCKPLRDSTPMRRPFQAVETVMVFDARATPFLALQTVMEFDVRATPFSGGENRYEAQKTRGISDRRSRCLGECSTEFLSGERPLPVTQGESRFAVICRSAVSSKALSGTPKRV